MITTTVAAEKETPKAVVNEKTKQQIIAVCCLTFFPLMYFLGKAIVTLF